MKIQELTILRINDLKLVIRSYTYTQGVKPDWLPVPTKNFSNIFVISVIISLSTRPIIAIRS